MIGFVSLAGITMAFAGLNLTAPVQIEGAVKNPGPVYIQTASSLKSTVELAGGFAKNADLRSVEVKSANGDVRTWNLYLLGLVPTVQPGDTIKAPLLDPKTVVFVEGPVANRAPIDFKAGLNLAEVLALSNPTNPKGMDRVIVTRAADAKKTTYKVENLPLVAPTILLMAGDTVTVPYSRAVQTSDKQLITILLVALLVIIVLK